MGFSLNGLSLVGRGVRTSNSDLRHAAGDTRYGTKGLPAKPGNFGGLGSLPSATPTIRTSPMDTSCLPDAYQYLPRRRITVAPRVLIDFPKGDGIKSRVCQRFQTSTKANHHPPKPRSVGLGCGCLGVGQFGDWLADSGPWVFSMDELKYSVCLWVSWIW